MFKRINTCYKRATNVVFRIISMNSSQLLSASPLLLVLNVMRGLARIISNRYLLWKVIPVTVRNNLKLKITQLSSYLKGQRSGHQNEKWALSRGFFLSECPMQGLLWGGFKFSPNFIHYQIDLSERRRKKCSMEVVFVKLKATRAHAIMTSILPLRRGKSAWFMQLWYKRTFGIVNDSKTCIQGRVCSE